MSTEMNDPAGRPKGDSDLSVVDWVLAILCSGIGCIVGIVYLIQGKPKAGKMVGFSILFMVLWAIVNTVIGMLGGAAGQ